MGMVTFIHVMHGNFFSQEPVLTITVKFPILFNRAVVGNLQPTGHMWPTIAFSVACGIIQESHQI